MVVALWVYILGYFLSSIRDEVLEQDGCVGPVADVGVQCVLPSGNCENRVPFTDTHIDVVESSHCTNSVFESPLTREDNMDVPQRLAMV